MANVTIPVALFGEGGAVSIRYDDVTLAINRVIIANATAYPIRCYAVHRANGQTVSVTCNAGQNRTYNVPAGYLLARDPEDGSLSYGMTEVYCQWPGEG